MRIDALALAVSVGATPPVDPFSDSSTSAPTDASAAAAATTGPTPAASMPPQTAPSHAAIPGVPQGVDLFDEATWVDLTSEQKDKLRVIRAEFLYQQQRAGQAPPSRRAQERARSDELDEIAGMRSERRLRLVEDDRWQEHDRSLVAATVATGTVWAVGMAVTIALAVMARQNATHCVDDVLGGSGDCTAELNRIQSLALGSYVVGGITGAVGVGFLTSGILLGVHRSNRSVRLSILPSGVRLRF